MSDKLIWSISELNRNVHRLTYENIQSGWEGWALIQSDEHWDNAHTDLPLLKRHHNEAQELNAPIFKFGDTLDLMQGKWDKRADQNQLREEHRGNNYLDKIVNTAASWYSPWSDQIALITPGNHEDSVLLRHETDMTERLVERLKQLNPNICKGSYWGYVLITFVIAGKTQTLKLHYHHGYGGGGEVTRGLIDHSRTRGQYNADIYVSGHIHRRNDEENVMTDVTEHGNVVKKTQWFIRSSTYKDETDGWHASKGRSARPLGGWWLRFRYTRTNGLVVDPIRAQ